MLPASSGRRQAFRSHDAAGAPLRRLDPTPAASMSVALDGGLWLSEMQHNQEMIRNLPLLNKDTFANVCKHM